MITSLQYFCLQIKNDGMHWKTQNSDDDISI